MGQEISAVSFSDEDRKEFQNRVREETKLLKAWFDNRRFTYEDVKKIGLEIEAWIIDRDHLPYPINEEFLQKAKSEFLVKELSQFNFEVNLTPHFFKRISLFSNESPIREIMEEMPLHESTLRWPLYAYWRSTNNS